MAAIAHSDSLGVLQAYPSPYDPRAGMSSSEKAAYNAALKRCTASAGASFHSIDGSLGPSYALAQRWMNVLSQIDASAPVIAAGKNALTCSERSGFRFTPINGRYEDGFLLTEASHAAAMDQHGEHSQAVAFDRQAAETFVRCFGPLEALRDRLRNERRAQFFSQNAQGVQEIETQTNVLVQKLEREDGVKL